MTRPLGESEFEETTIERLIRIGYEYAHAQELFQRGERDNLQEVILIKRLESFLARKYTGIPKNEVKRLAQLFTSPDGIKLIQRNMVFHQKLTKGIEFTYEINDESYTRHVYAVDWDNPEKNDFLVVNQLSIDGRMSRRPDVVIYINGLPLIVFELKNPNSERANVHDAYTQVQNYTVDISQLFNFNVFTVVSDNVETKHGMPFADFDFFASWKSIDGITVDNNRANTMRTLIEGLFPKERLLNYIKNFIVFLEEGDKITKIGAKYHQFFGVNFAVRETVRATRPEGDRKIGVMYHTTGSGKSLSMLFFAGILARFPELENPSIVIQVDRNDLDEQLFDTFVQGKSLIGHVHHAAGTDNLRTLLKGESGQVIFSTIEKFRKKEGEAKHPVLSERRNIVVIADEAHRTQSGFEGGYAAQLRYALPKASHIGFTGTPVNLLGNDTEEIFGHIIHRYDMAQAVADKATVPIFYESRLIPLDLTQEDIDEKFKDLIVEVGDDESEGYKRKWAALERIVGTQKRLSQLANDIVAHFNKVANPFQKGMIVCMSRRIAVDLYKRLREIDDCPQVEVIMTGDVSKDPKEWREIQEGSKYSHIKSKQEQEDIKADLKDPENPLKLVIVVDMWLTGMDAKPLSFLYVDKPMKGHNLMQAIARVNRVFPGKEGGTVVDYIGIATSLKEATSQYTTGGGKGKPAFDIEEAIAVFQTNLAAVRAFIPSEVDVKNWRLKSKIDREDFIADLVNNLLNGDTEEYIQAAVKLEKAYQLVRHIEAIMDVSDEVTLYQMIKAQLRKHIVPPVGGTGENKTLEQRLSELIDNSLLAKETVDIFQVAGIERPDISILDDAFLADLVKKEHEDLRLKLLKKLLEDKINVTFKQGSPKTKELSELLQKTLKDYHNRVIEAADVIRMMIKVRKDMDEEMRKRHDLGLSEEEIEFYKAITEMEHEAFSNDFLADLIHKVVKALKKELSVDWTSPHRQDVYAKVKLAVKMVLMKEKVGAQQVQFLTNKFMEQAEQQYKGWPMDA
ncbi:type I restriction endonuclease subunit R [Metabacillus sp. YM-086]|uniref:type I restriction endonuclease subunit R n=1 Tax=Metabacillus sp. YM-086 TaxID=3341729 RepID=UPI003A88D5D2